MQKNSDLDWFMGLIGALAAITVAGVLGGVRDTVGSSNIALLLAVLVTAVGIVGRRRGALATALSAALAYNFFQTEPIHTLRIAAAKDIFTVALLAGLGVLVGELSQRRMSAQRSARAQHVEIDLLHTTAETIRDSSSAQSATEAACSAVRELLRATDATFSDTASESVVPRITRQGTLESMDLRASVDGYDLGAEPISIDVAGPLGAHGRLTIQPTAGRPVSLDRRLGAVVVADQLALALSVFNAAVPRT